MRVINAGDMSYDDMIGTVYTVSGKPVSVISGDKYSTTVCDIVEEHDSWSTIRIEFKNGRFIKLSNKAHKKDEFIIDDRGVLVAMITWSEFLSFHSQYIFEDNVDFCFWSAMITLAGLTNGTILAASKGTIQCNTQS